MKELIIPMMRDYVGENAHFMKSTSDKFRAFMDECQKAFIHEALRRTKGNQLQAAKLMGLDRNTFCKRSRAFGFDYETYKQSDSPERLKRIAERERRENYKKFIDGLRAKAS